MTPTPANDNRQQQRPASFDSLLLAHEPYIRSRMFALEKDSAKHEDMYQEIIATALERWRQYRTTGNFAGWLYWIVRSVAHRRDRPPHGPAIKAAEPTQEYATDISLALSKMSRADEVLLSACGHSEADIARRFSVRAPTVHYRIKKARAALVAANDDVRVREVANVA